MTAPATARPKLDLQQAAREHLWLHFTRMGSYKETEIPVIVRGEGCYLEDVNGKRYLDALAGLFAVNVGYSYGEEMGQAALEQMRELPFYTNWSYAHPRAIELAAEVASLTPGDLDRVFFVSGGSEAVESGWKLARQYHGARGERRWKAVAHRLAYHGTTLGALSINGIAALRTPFEPLVPDVIHVHNTNRYHRRPDETEEEFTAFLLPLAELLDLDPELRGRLVLAREALQGAHQRCPSHFFAPSVDVWQASTIQRCRSMPLVERRRGG